MKKNRPYYAFTLIEVLIVIIMIGILMAMAMPSYKRYIKRAHYLSIISEASPYKLAVAECYALTQDISSCTSGHNGIPRKSQSSGATGLVHSIEVNPGGRIVITPNEHYGLKKADTYILQAVPSQYGITWQTKGEAVKKGYVG